MSRPAWRSAIDALRRGGLDEVVRGLRRRRELRRTARTAPDALYRAWLRRHEHHWLDHADLDRDEACRLLPLDDQDRLAEPEIAGRTGPSPEAGFVVGLGRGDSLRPGALHLLGRAIRDGAEIVYADEDLLTEEGPAHPLLKPAWSATLALADPGRFPGRPCAIAASLWDRLLREHAERSWTAALLRATELAECIAHVPLPLATRSKPPGAAGGEGHRSMIGDALHRRGLAARAEAGRAPGTIRIRAQPTTARVSVLVPTRDRPELLAPLAGALERESALQPLERVWLDHATVDPRAREILEREAAKPHSRVLRFEGDFNFSRMINAGAEAATGEYLLLLNNDVEPTAGGWIRDLAAAATLPGVGAVGPLLLYPGGTVQHAGIGLGMGTVTAHPFRGSPPETPAPCFGPLVAREVGAVSGACLMVSRDDYRMAGGLDEERLPISFSDVELCLRLRRLGRTILYEPAVTLIHHETVSRSPLLDPAEVAVMRSRWRDELDADPYLPPALSRLIERPVLGERLDDAAPRMWMRVTG